MASKHTGCQFDKTTRPENLTRIWSWLKKNEQSRCVKIYYRLYCHNLCVKSPMHVDDHVQHFATHRLCIFRRWNIFEMKIEVVVNTLPKVSTGSSGHQLTKYWIHWDLRVPDVLDCRSDRQFSRSPSRACVLSARRSARLWAVAPETHSYR